MGISITLKEFVFEYLLSEKFSKLDARPTGRKACRHSAHRSEMGNTKTDYSPSLKLLYFIDKVLDIERKD